MSGSQKIYPAMRILELSGQGAMYCGKLLAMLGADVTKVEPPEGDAARYTGPFQGGEAAPDTCIPFAFLNTGKKSVTLDYASGQGREILAALIKRSDVVLEGISPEDTARLHLGYQDIKAVNPGIIVASVTPFGKAAPTAIGKQVRI